MRVLVIPDIHLKPWLFDAAEKILKDGKADRAVCLMDIPDDHRVEKEVEKYQQAFDRAIQFAKDYPDTLWCYGNHEMAYKWGRYTNSYVPDCEEVVRKKMEEIKKVVGPRILFVHRIDKVIFSHAGLATSFVQNNLNRLMGTDIDSIISGINCLTEDELWTNTSPLWLRPQQTQFSMFRADEFVQVVGHTPVGGIFRSYNGVISTNTFSCNKEGSQYGPNEMIVIETTTGEFEKIPVSREEAIG